MVQETLHTSQWLRKLQKDDPEQYKSVFADFRSNVPASSGGRSKKKQPWKPAQLVSSRSTEAISQSRWGSNFEEMKFGKYITYFTEQCAPEDRMTDAEARIAWMKEPKHKIKMYSHKLQKHIDTEVVSVEVARTRHQEQIAAEKRCATVVDESVANASEQQIAAAASRALNMLSESFDDDLFAVPWVKCLRSCVCVCGVWFGFALACQILLLFDVVQ